LGGSQVPGEIWDVASGSQERCRGAIVAYSQLDSVKNDRLRKGTENSMIADEVIQAFKTENQNRQRSIMLGIPMFGGICHGDFALSLIKTVQVLTKAGFEVSIEVMMGDSLVPRARNNLAQRFLSSGKDMLMFLDADIVFGEYDIIKLILGEKELVAATYPRKRLNLDMYKEAVFKARKIGGKKYRGKDFGGGIVFQSYNLQSLVNNINELKK
jgi:hypothetical protein